MNDIVINKIQSMQRCIKRAREEFENAGTQFAQDHTRQDAAVLNITRACEQAIDLANHLIKTQKLGIPVSSTESFSLLAQNAIIASDMEQRLGAMTGFRNIAVHQYRELDIEIVIRVIKEGLDDLIVFGDTVLAVNKED